MLYSFVKDNVLPITLSSISLLITIFIGYSFYSLNSENTDLKDTIKNKESEITSLNSKLKESKQKIENCNFTIRQLNKKVKLESERENVNEIKTESIEYPDINGATIIFK